MQRWRRRQLMRYIATGLFALQPVAYLSRSFTKSVATIGWNVSRMLVSIIIPLYNREQLVRETLDSVLAQTYPHWECIIVDDVSTDNSLATAREYAAGDNRFKVFQRHREPTGAPTCRNIGLEKAEGEYVIFLDSDDLLADFCLERRVKKFAENRDCDFLVFQSVMFETIPQNASSYWNVENNESDLQRFLRVEALWQTAGAIYKHSAIQNRLLFAEGLPFWQDTELAVRLISLKKHYRKYLDRPPDLFIRIVSDGITRGKNCSAREDNIKMRLKILSMFVQILNENSVKLTKDETRTLWSSGFIFCGSLLREFSNHKDFIRVWFKFNSQMKMSFLRFILGTAFQYLFYLRKYSIYTIKLRNIYSRLFGLYLPNVHEFSNSKIYRVSLNEKTL